MNTDKVKLRNVKVEYIKGKYAYKQRINGLDPKKFKVILAGNIDMFKAEPKDLFTIYESERHKGRLDQHSRASLKGLQMNLSNPSIVKQKGVTHIILYEILND